VVVAEGRRQGGPEAEPGQRGRHVRDAARARSHAAGPGLGAADRGGVEPGEDDVEEDGAGEVDVPGRVVRGAQACRGGRPGRPGCAVPLRWTRSRCAPMRWCGFRPVCTKHATGRGGSRRGQTDFAPAAPTHSRHYSGAPPPNPRSSNAGGAEIPQGREEPRTQPRHTRTYTPPCPPPSPVTGTRTPPPPRDTAPSAPRRPRGRTPRTSCGPAPAAGRRTAPTPPARRRSCPRRTRRSTRDHRS
jgi:hypothetical protein